MSKWNELEDLRTSGAYDRMVEELDKKEVGAFPFRGRLFKIYAGMVIKKNLNDVERAVVMALYKSQNLGDLAALFQTFQTPMEEARIRNIFVFAGTTLEELADSIWNRHWLAMRRKMNAAASSAERPADPPRPSLESLLDATELETHGTLIKFAGCYYFVYEKKRRDPVERDETDQAMWDCDELSWDGAFPDDPQSRRRRRMRRAAWAPDPDNDAPLEDLKDSALFGSMVRRLVEKSCDIVVRGNNRNISGLTFLPVLNDTETAIFMALYANNKLGDPFTLYQTFQTPNKEERKRRVYAFVGDSLDELAETIWNRFWVAGGRLRNVADDGTPIPTPTRPENSTVFEATRYETNGDMIKFGGEYYFVYEVDAPEKPAATPRTDERLDLDPKQDPEHDPEHDPARDPWANLGDDDEIPF